MRLKFASLCLILATAAILISCNSADKVAQNNVPKPSITPNKNYPDGVGRVTVDELDAMMKNGQVFVADVRNQAMYDAGHIPGSKLIPVGDVANRSNEFPRDKLIVTYCS